MNYSSKKLTLFVAAVPLILSGLILLYHDDLPHTRAEELLDLTILFCAFLLSVLFYFYIRHLSRTAEQMLNAIKEFEARGDVDGLPVLQDDELGMLARAIAKIFKREKQHIRQLQVNEAKLNALFAVVNEGIVIADANGLIQDVNPSLCSMLGYSPAELKGQNVSVLMPAPYSVHHNQYMHNALESGSMGFMGMYRDLKALRKDGSSFEVELSVDMISVSGFNYFAATMRDVSEQRQHEQQLVNAKIKAEIASEAKSNFLSMMSHEIRTPLNGVMGTLELLADEIKNAEQRGLLTIASKSATSLLHIVDDVLDMSKVESGKMELEDVSFDLFSVLQESVELYSSRAMDKELVLELGSAEDLPCRLLGDVHRLRQILNNILGNAIKFTTVGSIHIDLHWRELDTDTIEARITISDTGIGVSEKNLEIIFEPFMQADNTISREYGGTGLGLSIVKFLAEKMGGSIKLSSIEGKGSHFIIGIPFKKSEPITSSGENWLQGCAVVCVDAEDEVLLDYLRTHGAVVSQATESELNRQATAQELQADLYICGKSSADLVNRIRQWQKASTPTQRFMLIGDTERSWEKGLDVEILLVRRPLLPISLDSLFQYLYDSENEIKHSAVAADGVMKKILLVEDNPVNQMVASAMLEKMGYEVVVATNGQLGVEAMKSQSIDLVLMDLHMPIMDGYEATRQIREMGSSVPILAMTADAGMADKENCLAAGMDDHLPKPIKMDVLQEVLAGWLAV
ncbi:MAG: ATP-binding protein [Gammaproteobacteria bacterium]|nr:ATP-binding protein [Gammaproteobacteria bacterium]